MPSPTTRQYRWLNAQKQNQDIREINQSQKPSNFASEVAGRIVGSSTQLSMDDIRQDIMGSLAPRQPKRIKSPFDFQ
jgi:hypothetical protein